MKLIVCVLLAVVGVAIATNTDIDWTTVRPLWQIKEWQDKHPAHMKIVRESGLLETPVTYGPSGRIAGGMAAAENQFPYMAGIISQLTTGNGFCGGSLVSRSYVMTAAHCLDTAISAIAVLGTNIVQAEGGQRIFATRANFNIYPNWNAESLLNDIAVIQLSQDAIYNDAVRSVRLPNWRQQDLTFAGQGAIVSGWGRTQNLNPDLSTTLQFARVGVMTNLACTVRFPTSEINISHICADGGTGGPCTGDMGGPLSVVEPDGITTQIGIVSWGLGFGCDISWPSVYLRTTTFLEWIDTNTGGTIAENW